MSGAPTELHDVPLCVDCDGTLIQTDLLHEGLLLLVKQSPASLFLLPGWLLRGKAYFKEQVAQRVDMRWETLPYTPRVLEIIQSAQHAKRKVVLATASPKAWAEGIAAHTGGFADVVSTEGRLNLAGNAKANSLSARYGFGGYDYVGNSTADIPVWKQARLAIVVSSNAKLLGIVGEAANVAEVVPITRAGLLSYLKMLRVHQWLKNLLVWVPLVFAHKLGSSSLFVAALFAFLAFSVCASAVYVINDLLDLESDRQHVRKRQRPFASGRIPVHHGVLIAPLLLAVAIGLALWVSLPFLGVLTVYFVTTLAYSLRLKRQVIVDVMLLAALYTMRILAGAVAVSVTPSFWLLALSMFVFLSLAIVKRYSELQVTLNQSRQSAAGRGYSVADLPVLLSLGVSAGMATVLVLALYIRDPETQHLYPSTLWLSARVKVVVASFTQPAVVCRVPWRVLLRPSRAQG